MSLLKHKLLIVSLSIFALTGAGAAYFLWDISQYGKMPLSNKESTILFKIGYGQNLKTTSNALSHQKIIKDPLKFQILARINKLDRLIKAGEYRLSPNMPPNEIIKKLVTGKVQLYKITIPEGYTMHQIANHIHAKNLGDKEAFLKIATDTHFALSLNIQGKTLEGYLFPDTYYFPKNPTARQIATTMVHRFWEVFKPEWKTRASQMNFSIHQIVTLASIIEKETGAAFERPLIGSVFHNRLNKKMRLESDPTVIYGIKNFDGNIKKKHLRTKTPYNTYMIKGLPPGPIANPGAKAIEAALFPATTDFLFFVSKKDSTHHFSTNIREHNRAVRKYQLNRKKRKKN